MPPPAPQQPPDPTDPLDLVLLARAALSGEEHPALTSFSGALEHLLDLWPDGDGGRRT